MSRIPHFFPLDEKCKFCGVKRRRDPVRRWGLWEYFVNGVWTRKCPRCWRSENAGPERSEESQTGDQKKSLLERLEELEADTIGGTGHLPPDECEATREYNDRTKRALACLIETASPNQLRGAFKRLEKRGDI
jgi:hypothetical protein